ncbi:MAG TPA: tripartite tricarboxylate transporter TctB family protein [Micropepsaceae bacterium]|nr:tripartite tricarboxylate transporter TctB family protein [Micropepsaceae bacterium]
MLEGRILVSAIMVVIFGGAVLLSFSYAPDARFLPLIVGIPGLILSAAQLVTELRARPGIKILPQEHRREVKMFAWFITFVTGLVLFGFLYAGPALVAAYLIFAGRERWYMALGAAVLTWAILFGIFERFLGLPLFDGLISQWIFG